jgi:Flp pilus assembly protein TadG
MKLPFRNRRIRHGQALIGSALILNTGRGAPMSGKAAGWRSHRGQVLVIFSGTFVILLLMSALVIDLAWLWNNSLRIQRTADAAALAGVVYLPNDVTGAQNAAQKEATRNGYTNATSGVTVTPTQGVANNRKLNVKVTAPVQTFFLGLIGINTVIISRDSNAEFVLPVPMGSPENYYGVFGDVRNATMTTTGTTNHPNSDAGAPFNAATAQPTGTWTTPANADATSNTNYAVSTTTNGSAQQWGSFGFTFNPTVLTIDGIRLQIRAFITGSGSPTTTCNLLADLSWNGGTTWTATKTQLLTTTKTLYTLGAVGDTWGHTWTAAQLANGSANFRVRLTWNKVSCGASRTASVDTLQTAVTYTYQTTGTTTTTATYQLYGPGSACSNGVANCFSGTPAGGGQLLNPRGFWGTMNTEGAANVNGDAYQPYYDTPTSGVALACPTSSSACYGPDDYYNYAIEMAPGTTGGYVYIFDPVFCETATASGTGDRHFSGTAAVSSFYELYSDPNNTPYIRTDDTLLVTSGNLFKQIAARDSTMGGTNGSECKQSSTAYGDGRDYHDAWYLLNPGNPLTGGANGTIYRLHTTGTDPSSVTQQRSTDGEQSFAIYATDTQAPTTYPKVYGLGAMQAFTPLSAAGSTTTSEFYLAQIDAVHKGKTLEIRLWDPGDTSPLAASLEILIPNSAAPGGYQAATVSYSGIKGTTNSGANSACNTNSSSSTTSIQTSTGASLGLFNGCWLTIDAVIPSWYVGDSQGWWKIRYTMSGNGTSNDVTTWTADIRGNPVHLVTP